MPHFQPSAFLYDLDEGVKGQLIMFAYDNNIGGKEKFWKGEIKYNQTWIHWRKGQS